MQSQILRIVLLAAIGNSMHISALPLFRTQKEKSTKHSDKESVEIFQEGEPIVLNCSAEGKFQSAFHWLFEYRYIEQSPLDTNAKNLMSSPIEHGMTIISTKLYIKNAKPEHSGKYTCIADSMTHRVVTSYIVMVEKRTEPLEEPEEKPENKDLRIYEWTSDILQDEGKPIYAVCRATQGATKPAPTIRWTIGDKPLTESDNIKIHGNGDLEVLKVPLEFHFWGPKLACHAISEDGHTVVSKEPFVYITPIVDDGKKMPF